MLSGKPLFTNGLSASVFTRASVRCKPAGCGELTGWASVCYGASAAAYHLGQSIDEQRRHERGRSHMSSCVSGASRARGPASAAGLPAAAARRTWPQVSINRCGRRGRGTFMSREQLTAEPRKHESRFSPPSASLEDPPHPSWPTLRKALPNVLHIDVRLLKQFETFP